jgi:hypothetical protein
MLTQLALEFSSQAYTQRWRERRQLWLPAHKGGFDSRRYSVEAIADDTTAKAFVAAHHYSQSCPAMVLRYGMYDAKKLVGVAILSVPVNEATLTNAFSGLIPNKEALELGRFCLLDEVPCNGETWLLKRVFQLAYQEGVRGIVSFSDPVARTNALGEIIFPGHLGRIYQLKEALYTGRSGARTLVLLPDGTILHERTRQKIRAQENGHEEAEKHLRDLGAPPRQPWEVPAQWLTRVLPGIGARKLRHQGNHRYLFPLDRRVRRYVRLPILPYPTK